MKNNEKNMISYVQKNLKDMQIQVQNYRQKNQLSLPPISNRVNSYQIQSFSKFGLKQIHTMLSPSHKQNHKKEQLSTILPKPKINNLELNKSINVSSSSNLQTQSHSKINPTSLRMKKWGNKIDGKKNQSQTLSKQQKFNTIILNPEIISQEEKKYKSDHYIFKMSLENRKKKGGEINKSKKKIFSHQTVDFQLDELSKQLLDERYKIEKSTELIKKRKKKYEYILQENMGDMRKMDKKVIKSRRKLKKKPTYSDIIGKKVMKSHSNIEIEGENYSSWGPWLQEEDKNYEDQQSLEIN